MLKRLHLAWTQAQHAAAAWRRWSRKLPHNRVHHPRLRDVQGRRIGYGPPTPLPEPPLPRSFCRLETLPSGRRELRLDDQGVAVAYRLARFPRPTAEQVQPLEISAEELSRLLDEACGPMV